jgi:hypothetical protein
MSPPHDEEGAFVLDLRAGARAARRLVFQERETGWIFAVVVAALFAVALAFGHLHHELWRDESHSWIMARQAQGFWDLVTGDRVYEGHPPLWFWYLRLWSLFRRQLPWLHVATIFAEVGAALILLRWGPFPRLVKVLIVFSYLMGFEYGVMSRNYTTGVVTIMAFAAVYHPLIIRRSVFLFLSLLSLSSIYGAVLSAMLLGCVAWGWLRIDRGEEYAACGAIWPKRVFWGSIVVLFVVAFTHVVSNPPDPNPFSPDWNFGRLQWSELKPALMRIEAAFFPLRKWGDRTFWVDVSPYTAQFPEVAKVLAYLLPFVLLVSLVPAWREMVTLVFAYTLMSVVMTTRYTGSIRHWGHFWTVFVVLSWLARRRFPSRRFWLNTAVLLVTGLCQVQGFVVALHEDWTALFSGAEMAADVIRRKGLADLPLVAGPDWFVLQIAGYLDKTYVSAETEEINQTVVFHNRRRPFSVEALVQRAVDVAHEKKGSVLVVSNRSLPHPTSPVRAFELMYSPESWAIHGDELFWVYRLDP